jgi:nitrogen fixation protein
MIPPLPKKLLEGPFLRGVEDQFAGSVIVLRDGVLLSLREQGAPAARNLL